VLENDIRRTDHRVRNVGFFEGGYLLGCQLHGNRCERVIEMVELGGADDRCGNDRLCQEPGKRHLGARDAACIRDFGHALDDLLIGLLCLGEQPMHRLGLGAHAGVVPVAAQFAARLRAPGDDAGLGRGRPRRSQAPAAMR
jgi:hypothetical protein